jgi:membrane protein YdbS with pleckstrin-like domain
MRAAEPGARPGTGDADLNWHRPSPRLLRARRIEVALVTVLLALIGFFAGHAASLPTGLIVAVAVVVAGFLAERFLARRVAAWGYAERDDDLMVRRGVLVRRQSVIPYGRMQFIDVTAGPVERGLSLATVRMHTAAAASDARIPGLERPEAARLRDQLAALDEAQAAGL